MKKHTLYLTALLISLASAPAFAQTTTPAADPNNAAVTQRDIYQQQRIDQA